MRYNNERGLSVLCSLPVWERRILMVRSVRPRDLDDDHVQDLTVWFHRHQKK